MASLRAAAAAVAAFARSVCWLNRHRDQSQSRMGRKIRRRFRNDRPSHHVTGDDAVWIIVPAGSAHLESKASALDRHAKAEALTSAQVAGRV